jgi:Domain of unknown function (DUF397)
MDHDDATTWWRKSSYSNNGGACVEVATNLPELVAVRDSKDPDGRSLSFSPGEWRTFITKIRTTAPGS